MNLRQIILTAVLLCLTSATAFAQCNVNRLERFLDRRAFELSADQKIELYSDRMVRYYDKRNVSRQSVYRSMRAWEKRWPERIYKFIRITDFKETDERDACRVTFDYRFLAYSPRRDKISAGIGSSTLVLADLDGTGDFKIIGELGDVRCRGLTKFARSRC